MKEDKMFFMVRIYDLFKELKSRERELDARINELTPYIETLFDIISTEKTIKLK